MKYVWLCRSLPILNRFRKFAFLFHHMFITIIHIFFMHSNFPRKMPSLLLPVCSLNQRKWKRRRVNIVPNDDRKSYPFKVANFVNFGDLDALRDWMNNIYEPTVVYTERFVHYVPVYDLFIELRGIDQVFDFYSSLLFAIPDISIQVQSSRLTLRQDGTSYIVSKMIYRGTHIHKVRLTDTTSKEKISTKFSKQWNPNINLLTSADLASTRSVSSNSAGGECTAMQTRSSFDDRDEQQQTHIFDIIADDLSSISDMSSIKADELQTTPLDESLSSLLKSRVKLCTPQTRIIIAGKKEPPVIIHTESTFVLYMNKQHKIYRIEVLKRLLPATPLPRDPFDASLDTEIFDDIDEEFTA